MLNIRYSNYFNLSKKKLDNGGFIGAVLMDLSKSCDCILHQLLLAKLHCYGIGKVSLLIENKGLK